MLLTRSPLSPGPKPWFSLDLHVLSAPPAFVLSQDQTLREETRRLQPKLEASLISSSSMLDRLPKEKEDGFISPRRCSYEQSRPREVSTFHAVEFSKTAPALRQQKTSDSHQRPSRRNHLRSYPLARKRSSRRVTGLSCLPFGRPGDGSRRGSLVNHAVCGPSRLSRRDGRTASFRPAARAP